MPTTPAISLTTPIESVDGVGPHRSEAFRRLGLRCVADLLLHLPNRYETEAAESNIADAIALIPREHGGSASIAIRGEIESTRIGYGRKPRLETIVNDDSGTMKLVWFNAVYLKNKLLPGLAIRAWGEGRRYGDGVQIANPRFELLDADTAIAMPEKGESFRPVYPAGETLTSAQIARVINGVLDDALPLLDEHFNDEYRRARDLPALSDAYRMVHRPETPEEVKQGRRRLAFDELLLMQLGVMMKRHHRCETMRAPALRFDEEIDTHIRARLPFTLTDDQDKVVKEIATDLQRTIPMNRLLQGDVGAGKTAVALHAMLTAVASNQQATLMAPTELLAEQHFISIDRMLEGSNVRLALLTSSTKPAARQAMLEALEEGEIDCVIGTHALLTSDVRFHALAVAIIDEQHRFGVHQRATMRTKTDETLLPHVLVMTATPIPRTLSLTVFGDLDISTIEGRPPGRQPIITRHIPDARAEEAFTFMNERLDAGEQGYVVVPTIEEGDAGLASIEARLDALRSGPLRNRTVAAVHGRLSGDEREAIMTSFRNGDVDTLVATTVIEVGVDVPNATIMVVENADRFGLAQLHQLRGRVGRGDKQSLCVLIADPKTEDGQARLNAMVETDDGFIIAERDLEIRGPGELFGSRQSGLAPFRVARLPRDIELLQLARADARTWIERSPTLAGDDNALLKRRLLKAHGKALGLGDVA